MLKSVFSIFQLEFFLSISSLSRTIFKYNHTVTTFSEYLTQYFLHKQVYDLFWLKLVCWMKGGDPKLGYHTSEVLSQCARVTFKLIFFILAKLFFFSICSDSSQYPATSEYLVFEI